MKKTTFFLLALTLLSLSACEFSVTTAGISDLKMCAEADFANEQCQTGATSFAADEPIIYSSAVLTSAPEDTEITIEWWYLDDAYLIDTVELVSEDSSHTIWSTLTVPDNGWPIGNYEVKYHLDADNVEDQTIQFQIVEENK